MPGDPGKKSRGEGRITKEARAVLDKENLGRENSGKKQRKRGAQKDTGKGEGKRKIREDRM